MRTSVREWCLQEFLAWGIAQEQGPVAGGILADEMGMGKTIQAVSLIVTHSSDGMPAPQRLAPALSLPPPSGTAATRPKLRLSHAKSAPSMPGVAAAACGQGSCSHGRQSGADSTAGGAL